MKEFPMRLQPLLLLALAGLTLSAQGRFRPDRPRRDPPERHASPRRDRIVARLHEIRSDKLQRTLGLNEAKAHDIADRWGKFDEDSFARRQKMAELRQQMNAVLMGPGTEDEKNKKLQPVVEQLASHRQQQQEARKHFEGEILGSLTPAQQGRFILLVEEFQKTLQDAIQEQRKVP
jgi:hypothetical protein